MSDSSSASPEKRSNRSWLAAVIGLVSIVMIASTFSAPWYEIDKYFNDKLFYHDEYSLLYYERDGVRMDYGDPHAYILSLTAVGIGAVGDLMSTIALLAACSLAASIIAFILTLLCARTPGVIVGAASAALILLAGCLFYLGIIDALDVDGFSGFTPWSRSSTAYSGPMIGYVISVAAALVQSTQAITLAYSGSE